MREVITCDVCRSEVATAPSLDEMLAAVPAALRPILGLIPGGAAAMRDALTKNIMRCMRCSAEGK